MSVGPLEILVILILALLVFGPNKLPELARTVGGAMRELRRLQRMVQRELDDVMAEPAPRPSPPADGARSDTAGDLTAADGPEATPEPDRDA
jgi:sec-independent protein translocase protein TatA